MKIPEGYWIKRFTSSRRIPLHLPTLWWGLFKGNKYLMDSDNYSWLVHKMNQYKSRMIPEDPTDIYIYLDYFQFSYNPDKFYWYKP